MSQYPSVESRGVGSVRVEEIPVIERVDVAIVEGTASGCALAHYLAERGMRVALLCSGSSPMYEVATCLRPFLHGDEIDGMPAAFARIFDPAMKAEVFETSFVHVGMVTEGVEDLLLDEGVAILYSAQPAGALMAGNRMAGVVLGGKYGFQAVLAPVVVDCTPIGSVAHMAGARFQMRSANPRVRVTYSFLCKDQLPALEHYQIPENVATETEIMTRGFYAEYRRMVEFDLSDPLTNARTAGQIRRDLVAIGYWDRRDVPILDIVRGADAFLPDPFRRLQSVAAQQHQSSPDRSSTSAPIATAADPAQMESADVPHLYVLSQCADLDDSDARGIHRSYHQAIYHAMELSRAIVVGHLPDPVESQYELRTGVSLRDGRAPEGVLSVSDPSYREPVVDRIRVGLPDFQIAVEADVVVVGAGSSGSPAAVAAASSGAAVLCLDKHGDVGGTNTIGGVTTPWFGHRPPYFQKVQKRLRSTKRKATVPHALALAEWLAESGVAMLPNMPVAGVYRSGERVTAVLAVGPLGPIVVPGRIVIDATGDGDLAAMAGVPYTYGTERDEATQWCSFGKFTDKRPSVSRKYRSIIDVRSIRDISRGMVIGRRQEGMFGAGEYPQYYLTPRESRHISCQKRLTFLDGMSERRFPDGVAVHYSNFDIKGPASSDLVMMGFMDRERYRCYETYIPYGTMIPSGIANVLVTGKAYAASHDVLGLARQVADVMCQGAAAGYAAAMAASDGDRVDRLDVGALQQQLMDVGLLAQTDLEERPLDPEQALDAFVRSGDFKHLGRLAAAGECAASAIRARWTDTSGDIRNCLARLLCYHGDSAAADYLIEELEESLCQEALPSEGSDLTNVPNHGYAPEPVYSICALALMGDERIIPILASIPEHIELPVDETDVQYSYVYAVAYAAERMVLPGFVPVLVRLLDNPGIADGTLDLADDPRKTVDWVKDRYAYLELCLARALARCGEARGYEVLIRFLTDLRVFLSRSALLELVEITGEDFAFDQEAWKGWLERARGSLAPVPLTRRFD